MVVKEGIEWTVDRWLVEGSSKGKTRVGVGRGVAVVVQSKGRQTLVDGKQYTEVVESSRYELVMAVHDGGWQQR